MNIYASRSKKFSITIIKDGIRKAIRFNGALMGTEYMCVYIDDPEEQELLEAAPCYGSEFWLHEVIKDKQDTKPVPVVEASKSTSDKSEKETDYPEVTNGQKAKLLLLSLIPGSVHADFVPAHKAREAAKKLNITFSNWLVQ